jgi:hypothetical protein
MQYIFKNNNLILILLLVSFTLINNIYFLNLDTSPLIADNYIHHQNSLNTFYSLKEGDISNLMNQYINFPSHQILFLPSLILYPFFGTSEDVTAFQGTIFLIILIIATYLFGKELFNKEVGLLSAVFVSFSPFILALSKVPYDDIELVSTFTLTLYFFLRSKKFSNIKYTWFFNISLGIAILSKFGSIFIILILIPLYLFFIIFFNRKEIKFFFQRWRLKNFLHFLISFFISIILPFRYYSIHFLKRFGIITSSYNIKEFHFNSIFSSFILYLKTLHLNFEYSFIFVIFIVSLVFFFLFSKKNKLLIISLIVAANIYHIFLIMFFSFWFEDLHRHLIFIKPIYILIISLFFVKYIKKFLFNILKKLKYKKLKFTQMKNINPFIIILIIIFISFTLAFNYTDILDKPKTQYSLFEKYHPIGLSYNVGNLLENIYDENQSINIFIFSPQNDFLDIFNTYIPGYYKNLNIFTIDLSDKSIHYMDDYVKKLDNYHYLGDYKYENGSFNFSILNNFDYLIIPSNNNLYDFGDYKKFYFYHKKIYPYILNNHQKFLSYKEINISDIDTQLFIYKTK